MIDKERKMINNLDIMEGADEEPSSTSSR